MKADMKDCFMWLLTKWYLLAKHKFKSTRREIAGEVHGEDVIREWNRNTAKRKRLFLDIWRQDSESKHAKRQSAMKMRATPRLCAFSVFSNLHLIYWELWMRWIHNKLCSRMRRERSLRCPNCLVILSKCHVICGAVRRLSGRRGKTMICR